MLPMLSTASAQYLPVLCTRSIDLCYRCHPESAERLANSDAVISRDPSIQYQNTLYLCLLYTLDKNMALQVLATPLVLQR